MTAFEALDVLTRRAACFRTPAHIQEDARPVDVPERDLVEAIEHLCAAAGRQPAGSPEPGISAADDRTLTGDAYYLRAMQEAGDAMAEELDALAKDTVAASGDYSDGEWYRTLAFRWYLSRPPTVAPRPEDLDQ